MQRVEIARQAVEISPRPRRRIQPFRTIARETTALLDGRYAVRISRAGRGRGDSGRARTRAQHQPARGRAARRPPRGRLDRLDLRAGVEKHWPTFFDFIITGAASEGFRLAFAEGEPAHALWPEIDRRPDDLVVSKDRLTPFADAERALETMLRARGIEMVLVVGTVTNAFRECAARDGATRTFKTIMISDANGSPDDEEHNATLSIFLQAFGGVLYTEEAIGLIEGAEK